MWQALVLAGIAALCGAVFTRLARDAAIRFGLVDKPDGRRKVQARAVPLAGGVGVLLGAVTALAFSLLLPGVAEELGSDARRGVCLLIAATIISLVGLADDARNLRARYKLAGQIAASLVVIFPGGLLIERVSVFEYDFELGPVVSFVFTLFWFLAAINALNLLDGMDGLLGTIGFVVCGALAGIAFLSGQPFAGLVAAALAGSLVGFLRYNMPPASVYLGDCGSMLIGLVVAALAIQASLKGPAMALVAPTAILVLPLIDTSAAIVRRKLTGRGLAIADRGHLHHVLQRSGMTIRRVLVLVTVLGLLAAGGALVSVYMKQDGIALFASAAVVLILVAGGLFGNAEFRLVRERAIAFVKSATGDSPHVETEVRLHGSAHWGEVWKDITARADQLNLQTVCLDVNAPVWHEDYHVRWDRVGPATPPFKMWKAEIPLVGQGQMIGRLTVCGPRDEDPIADKLARLSDIVDSAERRASEVARAGDVRPTAPAFARSEPSATPA
jgi:UDP-GlcNAc:undecaprenyl-phosphate GlcNAc-1-phosphate transferase